MELEIISMTPQERMYSYSQSSQIEAQTGCIGHLRGDFGAGQEFFTSWFEHRGEYKTDEFKAEFDEVVNSLREKEELLFSRDSMIRYQKEGYSNMVFTSNRDPAQWKENFCENDALLCALDRIFDDAVVFTIGSVSRVC